MTSISPSDDELATVLRALRAQNPTTGAAKLIPLLLEAQPTWTVSEKRLRKILQREGLTAAGGGITSQTTLLAEGNVPFPTSRLVAGLDTSKWTAKVRVHDFGPKKGKGLVATQAIKADEHVWNEEPLLVAPEPELDDFQRGAQACLHCAKPINQTNRFPIECRCSGMYCNRLCSTRGGPAHAYICPVQNPASVNFMNFIRQEKWKAPGAWARVVALLFSCTSRGAAGAMDMVNTLAYIHGLAGLSLDKRVRALTNWEASQTASEALWKRTHQLFVEAFLSPPSPAEAKTLSRLKGKNSLPDIVLAELFDYDAFLLGLGKMSLNMEAHGGLYVLHSHMNHSCSPNVSVRHITPNNSQRITIVARRAIEPGEELLVSYVNPELDVRTRRRELKEWNFGVCQCDRCVEEEKSAPVETEKAELEDEIRGFLGV